jgi:peptidoglycan/xylan/chitin deacetylase (PgdA/CDA1 family)
MDLKNMIKNIIISLSSLIKNADDSKCIFYHDIHSKNRFTDMSTPVDLFVKHINVIRELGFEIVHEITKEKNQISISFDDGFKGLYKNIGIINKLEVPITIFVVSSFLDRDNFLTTHNLKELAINKFIKIQSHTFTHAELPTLDSDSLQMELKKSKEILESICETEMNSICFPKGLFDKSVIKKSSEVGYNKQFSSLPGSYHSEVFPSVKRRSLVQSASEKEFKSILKGGDNILYYWYYKKHFVK